jgi:acyl carrier protein
MTNAGGAYSLRKGEAGMTVETNVADISVRVAAVMIEELKLEDVTPETFDPDIDLVDEIGIDSMDLATVALVLQDHYGIRFDEDDYPTLTSINKIAAYIAERLVP